MKINIITIVFILFFSGCKTTNYLLPVEIKSLENDILIRFPKNNQSIKAVAVIAHGLNFKPEKMDDWSALLVSNGAITMRFSLYGHNGDLEFMRQASEEIWRQQFDKALIKAHLLAEQHGVPLLFLGYSLGALLGVDWLSRQVPGSRLFDKMLLLAPAIATPWYSELAKKILSQLDPKLIIPTPSPKGIRANQGSSVNAYQSLFRLKDYIEVLNYKNANIPTLVIVDKYDELTPFEDIKYIIRQRQLSLWEISLIDNKYAKENYSFRHLIADKKSVGLSVWQQMSTKVLKYFGLHLAL